LNTETPYFETISSSLLRLFFNDLHGYVRSEGLQYLFKLQKQWKNIQWFWAFLIHLSVWSSTLNTLCLLSKWENFLSATWVFFSILWCSQIDDHWQEELPKFGYRPYMIIKDFKNPFIFWLFAWSCCKNLTISFSISEEIMALLHKIPLYVLKLFF
jgi:hypothetical protein